MSELKKWIDNFFYQIWCSNEGSWWYGDGEEKIPAPEVLQAHIKAEVLRGLEAMEKHINDRLDTGAVDDFTSRAYIRNYIEQLKQLEE